jgi:hypothetical protein
MPAHLLSSDPGFQPTTSALRRALATAALVMIASGCVASSSTIVTATPSSSGAGSSIAGQWPVRVREHVDLWLHGYALLWPDSSLVPYFRPGYRDGLLNVRQGQRLTTQLDANAARLRARLQANPALLSAQFVPLYFSTWDELRRATDAFMRLQGDARMARDAATSRAVATLAAYFGSAADREWLQLFVQSLEDERNRFYGSHWLAQQRAHGPAIDQVRKLWNEIYRARFERFLVNSRQRDGEMLLVLALGGEGRTLAQGNRPPSVAVGLPSDGASAAEAILVFAHEVVGTVASAVVTDHTSPVEQRSGVADRYTSLAAVHGGAMLLERIAPELVTDYQKYYLGLAGLRPRDADRDRVFQQTYALPEEIRAALARQIGIILDGI